LPESITPHRHVWRWISGLVLLLILALIIRSLADNPNIQWATVRQYLFSVTVLQGLKSTVLLAVISFVLSFILGTLVAFGRIGSNPVVRILCVAYIWIARGIPALIQILFWGNFALFLPTISLGIPGGPTLFSVSSNKVFTSFVASIVALTVASGAYEAEVVRSGITSVDKGQQEAARALGMTWWAIQRKVTFPQAIKVIIPPSGSIFITILKETALVSVIAGGGLLTATNNIAGRNFRVIELLLVASLWYLVVTAVFSIGQHYLEKRAKE
jgi:polar amino acid transport system permease protein